MTLEDVTTIVYHGVMTTITVSLPSVALGLLAGLLVAVFQAVTQIQEQTLAFVPKMIVILVVVAMTFSWMSDQIVDYTLSLWQNIPRYAK